MKFRIPVSAVEQTEQEVWVAVITDSPLCLSQIENDIGIQKDGGVWADFLIQKLLEWRGLVRLLSCLSRINVHS